MCLKLSKWTIARLWIVVLFPQIIAVTDHLSDSTMQQSHDFSSRSAPSSSALPDSTLLQSPIQPSSLPISNTFTPDIYPSRTFQTEPGNSIVTSETPVLTSSFTTLGNRYMSDSISTPSFSGLFKNQNKNSSMNTFDTIVASRDTNVVSVNVLDITVLSTNLASASLMSSFNVLSMSSVSHSGREHQTSSDFINDNKRTISYTLNTILTESVISKSVIINIKPTRTFSYTTVNIVDTDPPLMFSSSSLLSSTALLSDPSFLLSLQSEMTNEITTQTSIKLHSNYLDSSSSAGLNVPVYSFSSPVSSVFNIGLTGKSNYEFDSRMPLSDMITSHSDTFSALTSSTTTININEYLTEFFNSARSHGETFSIVTEIIKQSDSSFYVGERQSLRDNNSSKPSIHELVSISTHVSFISPTSITNTNYDSFQNYSPFLNETTKTDEGMASTIGIVSNSSIASTRTISKVSQFETTSSSFISVSETRVTNDRDTFVSPMTSQLYTEIQSSSLDVNSFSASTGLSVTSEVSSIVYQRSSSQFSYFSEGQQQTPKQNMSTLAFTEDRIFSTSVPFEASTLNEHGTTVLNMSSSEYISTQLSFSVDITNNGTQVEASDSSYATESTRENHAETSTVLTENTVQDNVISTISVFHSRVPTWYTTSLSEIPSYSSMSDWTSLNYPHTNIVQSAPEVSKTFVSDGPTYAALYSTFVSTKVHTSETLVSSLFTSHESSISPTTTAHFLSAETTYSILDNGISTILNVQSSSSVVAQRFSIYSSAYDIQTTVGRVTSSIKTAGHTTAIGTNFKIPPSSRFHSSSSISANGFPSLTSATESLINDVIASESTAELASLLLATTVSLYSDTSMKVSTVYPQSRINMTVNQSNLLPDTTGMPGYSETISTNAGEQTVLPSSADSYFKSMDSLVTTYSENATVMSDSRINTQFQTTATLLTTDSFTSIDSTDKNGKTESPLSEIKSSDVLPSFGFTSLDEQSLVAWTSTPVLATSDLLTDIDTTSASYPSVTSWLRLRTSNEPSTVDYTNSKEGLIQTPLTVSYTALRSTKTNTLVDAPVTIYPTKSGLSSVIIGSVRSDELLKTTTHANVHLSTSIQLDINDTTSSRDHHETARSMVSHIIRSNIDSTSTVFGVENGSSSLMGVSDLQVSTIVDYLSISTDQAVPSVLSSKTTMTYESSYSGIATSWTEKSYVGTSKINTSGASNTDTVSYVMMSSYLTASFGVITTKDKQVIFSTTSPNYSSSSTSETIRTELRLSSKLQSSQSNVSSAIGNERNTISISTTITELPSVEVSHVSLKWTSSFSTFSESLLVATTDIISSTSNSTTSSTLTDSQQTISSLSNDSFMILPTSTFVMQQENASSQAMLSDLSTSSQESTTHFGTSGVFGTFWFTKNTDTVIVDTGSQLSSHTKHVSIVFKSNSYSTNLNDIFTSAGSSLQSGDSLAYTSTSSLDVLRTSSSSSMVVMSDFTYMSVDFSSILTTDTLGLGALSDSNSLFEPSNIFASATSSDIKTVDTYSVTQEVLSNTNSVLNSVSYRVTSVTDLDGSFLIDLSDSQSSEHTLNVIQQSNIVYSTSVSLSPTYLEVSPSIVTTPPYSSVSSVMQSSYVVTTPDVYSTEVSNAGVNLNTTSSNNIATDTFFDTATVGTLPASYTFGNLMNLTVEHSSIFNSGVHGNQNTSTLKPMVSNYFSTLLPSSTFQASILKTFSMFSSSGAESSISHPVDIDTSFDFESTEIFASTSTMSTPFLSSEYGLSSYVSLLVSSSAINTLLTTTTSNNSMLFFTNLSSTTSTRSSLSTVASFISTTTDDFTMSDITTSSTTALNAQSPLGSFTISPMSAVSTSGSFEFFESVSSLSHQIVIDTSFYTESTFAFDSIPNLSTQITSSESLLPSYIAPLLSPSTMETDLPSTTRNNTMLFTSDLPSSSSFGVNTKGISSLLISQSFIYTTSGDLTTSGFTNSISTLEAKSYPESAESSSLSVASTSVGFQFSSKFVSFSSTYSPIGETSYFQNSSVPTTEYLSYASKESTVSPSEVTRTMNSDDVLSFSSDFVLDRSSHSAESKFSFVITPSIIYSSTYPLELSSAASSIRTLLSSVVSQSLSAATQTLESIKDGLVSESLTMSSTLVSPVPTYDSESLTEQAIVTPIHSPDSSLLSSPRISQSFTRYSDLSSVVEPSAHPSSYSHLILSSSPVVSQKPSSTGQISFDVESSDETSRYLETHISVTSASTVTAVLLSTDAQESTKSTDTQSRSLHPATVSTERLTASTSVIISTSITPVTSMESVIYSTALLETISPTSASMFMTNDSMMNSLVLTTAFTESINSTDVLQSQNVSAENETTATFSITLSPTSILETVSFTSSIFNPTTEPPVVTTRNITNVEETFWVRTVLKIRRGIDITSPTFVKEMERRLAVAFNEAFVIEKLIQEGKYQPLQRRRRKKRFATSGEAAVHIHDLTRHKDSSTVTVVYAVEKSGEIMTSQDAVTSLQVFDDQELAIILQQVVDMKAETYSQTSEPEVPTTDDNFPLWMIGAIAGGVAGVIIIIWIVLCIYCKCCKRKESYEETEPELTSILPERPKRKESKSRPLSQSPMKKSIEPHTSHYNFKQANNYKMSVPDREPAEVIDTRKYIETPVRREPLKHPQHSSPECSTTATPVLPKRELAPPAVRKGRRNSKNSIGPSIDELQLRRGSVLSKERKSDVSQLFQSTVSEDSDSVKDQIKTERKKNKELLREQYGLDMEIPVDFEHRYDDRDKIMLDMPNTSVPNFVIATGSPAKKKPSEQRRHSEGSPVDDENLVKAKNRMHELLDDAFSLISPRQHESYMENDSRTTKNGLRNSNRETENTNVVRSSKETRLPFSGYTNPGYTNSSEYFETWSPYRASDQVALISMPHTLVSSVTKLGGKSDKRPTTPRIGRRPASNLDILNTKVAAQPSENKKLSAAHSMTRDPAEPIKLRTKDSNSGHRLASAKSRSSTSDFKANNGKPKASSLNSGLILNGSVTSLSKISHTDLSRSKKESVEMKPLNQNGLNTIRNHRAPERNIQRKDEIDVIQSIKPIERTDNLIQSLRDELKTLTKPETEDDINKKPLRRKNKKVNKPMTDIM